MFRKQVVNSEVCAELVLGTVQFGMNYGIANVHGQPSKTEVESIITGALRNGVTHFDTARAYGESENVIGDILSRTDASSVSVITKLTPLKEIDNLSSESNIISMVDESIQLSLKLLRTDRLDYLLLHEASLLTKKGGLVLKRLNELKTEGFINKLGVSVQSVDEAESALKYDCIKLIQLPFNILDWRWNDKDFQEKLAKRKDIIIHARSILLQGLLLINDKTKWPIKNIDFSQTIINKINELVKDLDRENIIDLCVSYARAQKWIHGLVIGADTLDQFNANCMMFGKSVLSSDEVKRVENYIPKSPVELLDPSKWEVKK